MPAVAQTLPSPHCRLAGCLRCEHLGPQPGGDVALAHGPPSQMAHSCTSQGSGQRHSLLVSSMWTLRPFGWVICLMFRETRIENASLSVDR